MTPTDEQLERYARHIVLKEVGGTGQQRLLNAHIVVIGAGGIGSPALQYLAAAGVGRLTVIDDDHVDLGNLQRQTLFATGDVGHDKVDVAARRLVALNPDVEIAARRIRIDTENACEAIAGADVVLDGCDNFATRFAVADAALAARIPLVSAAVGEFEGQVGMFRGWEDDKPCYRCFTGADPERAGVSCSEQGVLGALTGVIGSTAALEAMRAIIGFGEDSAGKILLVDTLALRFRTLRLPKDPACPACGA